MIQKFEKRKQEKDMKIETPNEHKEERNKKKAKKNTKDENKTKEKIKTVKHSSVEPSPNLIHRLSLGGKSIVSIIFIIN